MTKWNEIEEKIIEKYENELTFTDRESYLKWRSEWRERYKELSADIRTTRRSIVENMKAGQYAGRDQYRRMTLASDAYTQLLYRAASKRKSAKQREAMLAEKAAA